MPCYKTYLVNFGYSLYEGDSLAAARAAAVRSGFESVISVDEQPILSYSPLSGWRGLVATQGCATTQGCVAEKVTP
jgi:hypothetical protein